VPVKPSENPDDGTLFRLRKLKPKFEWYVDALSERDRQRLSERRVTQLGNEPPPPDLGTAYAVKQLLHAERELEGRFAKSRGAQSLAPLRSSLTGEQFRYTVPPAREAGARRSRFAPLTLTYCPDLADYLFYQLPSQSSASFRPVQRSFAAQLAEALRTEVDLWIKAGQERVPYPFAYSTLQYLQASEDARSTDLSLCLRCGELIDYPKRRRVTPAFRCESCAGESSRARAWPAHGLMPHTRGKWWLRCQAENCEQLFRGRRQALRCDQHRLERVTPRRRVRLKAEFFR
jgi:hypothetical protein